jgi:hypothetical protein
MECQKILSNCRANALQCGTPQDMAVYKRIVDACVHPATGEIIPAPFRVSAIAPVNIPIVFLMLTTPSSNIAGTLFLHWVNQSYNTACNYFNRSGNSQPLEDIAKAYGLATVSACSLAFGLGKAHEARNRCHEILGQRAAHAAVLQLHRVDAPMTMRRQITFYDEPVNLAIYRPGKWPQRTILFSRDVGGDEMFQMYLLNERNGDVVRLSDGKTRNTDPRVSRDGKWVAWLGGNLFGGVRLDGWFWVEVWSGLGGDLPSVGCGGGLGKAT